VERGVPFGFAQGRLSTAFGFRLTSLRMTAREGMSFDSAQDESSGKQVLRFAQDDKLWVWRRLLL
jgi:hypothetical protein